MSKSIDYKSKYQALMARFMATVDQAHQIGYEKGYNQGSQDTQAQQMADMQAAQAGQVDENGNPIQDPNAPPGQDPMQGADDAQMQQGTSEVDQHLNELEGLVKGEKKTVRADDLSKILSGLNTSFRKIQEAQASASLRKSLAPMDKLKKVNKVAKKHSLSFQANVSQNGKKALSMNEQIIENMMKSWDEQEKDVIGDIAKVLGSEGHNE